MTLEEMTINELEKQISNEEKELKERKQQLLAKKVMIKMLTKEARKNKPALPNKFLNTLKFKLTSGFAKINKDADLALRNPAVYMTTGMCNKAKVLLSKAIKIEDNTHSKANKLALKCAEAVVQLELFMDENSKNDFIFDLAQQLDKQVQRLRSTPKLILQEGEQPC